MAVLNPEIKTFKRYLLSSSPFLFPSLSNSFAAFADKENADELNGVEKKQMESDMLNPNTHDLRN